MASRSPALAKALPPAPYSLDYIAKRQWWFYIAAALLAIAVASLLLQGFNVGLDFTSGTQLTVVFAHGVQLPAVRSALHALGVAKYLVVGTQPFGRGAIITLPVLSEAKRLAVQTGLASHVGHYTLVQLNKVSGTVAQSIITGGVEAVIAAAGLIVLYMIVRFDFRFALTGVAAIFWDAIVTMGLISLFRVEISAAFIAGILMIIGYSLNDRIIIFDRVRENLRLRQKGDSLAELVNRSLNQTLGRSINTAVIVILAMMAILILGGASTRDLAATVVIGVFFGAFSSILLATPLWYSWMQRDETRSLAAEAAAAAAARGARRPSSVAAATSSAPSPRNVPAQPTPAKSAPAPARSGAPSAGRPPSSSNRGGKKKHKKRPPQPEPKV